MVEIPRYYAGRVGPQVTQQPAAPGGMAAFGAALGDTAQAVARFGQQRQVEEQRTLREALSQLDARQRQQDGLAIQRAQLEAETWAGQALDTVTQAAPEDGAGVEEDLRRRFTAYRGEVLGKLTSLSPEAREMLELRLDGIGAGMASRGGDFQIKARTAKAGRDFGAIVDGLANGAMSDPDSYDRQMARVSETLDLFDLPATAKGKLLADARASVADATIRGRIDRDPATALAELDKGKWDAAIDPRVKTTLRNVAEAGVRTQRAEAEQAARVAQAEMSTRVNDMAAALRAGMAVPVPAARIQQVLGAERGGEALAMLDRASAYGRDAAALRWASPAEMESIVAGRRDDLAANDIRDFGERQRDAQAVAGMAAERQRQLFSDPAAYVAAAPVVQERRQAIAQTETTLAEKQQDGTASQAEIDGVGAAWRSSVTASLAEQERLGVDEASRRILSKGEAAGIVAEFQSPGGFAVPVAQRLAGLQARYGEHWHRAFAELVDAGLPPGVFLLGTMTEPGQEAAQGALSEALRTGDKALRELVKPDEAMLLRAAVQDRMAPFVATSSTEGGREDAARLSQGVETLALHYMAAGASADDAATRAYDGAIAAQYTLTDSYRVPKRYDADQVEDAADAARSALAKVDAPPSRYGDIWANQAASYLRQVKRKGYWINTADDMGLRLMDPQGLPVTVDGKPVIMPFDPVPPP